MSRLRVVGPGDPPPPSDRESWQRILDDLLAMHGQVGEMRAECSFIGPRCADIQVALVRIDDALTQAAAQVQGRLE